MTDHDDTTEDPSEPALYRLGEVVEERAEFTHTREEISEPSSWSGKIKIIVRRSGRAGDETLIEEETVELENLITDAGRNLMALALRDVTALPEITFVALGDDATAPVVGDVLLGNEVFRKVMTQQVAGATGVSISTVFIAPQEANQQLEEIGWFAGDASATVDTGTLVARVLFSRLKDNLESIQIERTDTIS